MYFIAGNKNEQEKTGEYVVDGEKEGGKAKNSVGDIGHLRRTFI